MSKDKYVLKALSVSGASGDVIRKYKAPGVHNILKKSDFKEGAVESLIDSGFLDVASEAQIKAAEQGAKKAEIDVEKKKVKADYQADYKAIAKEAAPKSWTVDQLKEEISILKDNASGNGDSNESESGGGSEGDDPDDTTDE